MKISVVIPTLDEAARIVGAVESALDGGPRAGPGGSESIEVLVVDGGSRDATRRLAREAGARVLPATAPKASGAEGVASGPRGRAHQLRLGSEEAKGDVLLFLHADTRLPAGWTRAVEAALQDPAVAGGAFALRFAERGLGERWIEAWVALRVRLLGLPYGDQALFLRRDVLERMGGVPDVPIMEDLDLVRGIARAGRLARLSAPVSTSSRRYRSKGFLRTLFWHQVALLGWRLGWDRARLAARMGR